MDSLFSSDKLLLVTIPEIGYAQLVDVDVTAQFDGSKYTMIVRGGLEGGVPVVVPCVGNHPSHIWGGLTAYATAAKIVSDLGLPKGAISIVQQSLENDFAPRLRMWLEDTKSRILHPEPKPAESTVAVAPLVPVSGDVLIQVDRDVSPIFGKPEASYRLEYTLFSEPKLFRCILACHKDGVVKVVDFQKKTVHEIMQHLNSDNLAFEIARYFGSDSSRSIYLLSCILKLSFGVNTGLAKHMASQGLAPVPVPAPQQETVTLPAIEPIRPHTFRVFNGDGCFEIPEPA